MTEKNKGGRPTKYQGDETIKIANEYIDFGFIQDGDIFPTEYRLALLLGIGSTTLDRWEEEHEEFRGVLDRLKQKQGALLVNNGLSGSYNATITKLLMSSRLGIHEKSEVDSNVKTSVTIIDDIKD